MLYLPTFMKEQQDLRLRDRFSAATDSAVQNLPVTIGTGVTANVVEAIYYYCGVSESPIFNIVFTSAAIGAVGIGITRDVVHSFRSGIPQSVFDHLSASEK
jgi:hypothetical protein